jgi:hypothetical protein
LKRARLIEGEEARLIYSAKVMMNRTFVGPESKV